MAERRSSWHKRCPVCKINKELCFCSEIKTFDTKSRLLIMIHRKEMFLPSNTANLLARNFPSSCNMHVIGDKIANKNVELTESYYPIYLYPDDTAVELTKDFIATINQPIELIIPDGTWRQAKKMKRRTGILKDVRSVKLSGDFKSSYALRKQKYENGLCTYEAAAKALGIIEGPELEALMLKQFEIMNLRFKSLRPF